ncbi:MULTISPECIES: EexN family lipoprotein [Rhodobacterales]|uniref:EexN family lipoprotein n=1 Tax=Rhodobacterales TaxID=204455 RepID=UPI001011D808|nr:MULTISPECIES: EexN family lipoprotein [Roseobacteraceae]MCF6433167.1 EexN family lipoprotein [Leisingera sp. MMG026]MCZ4258727.1 EexN family lipoprotein [Sulfitobacter sp. G21635-S1]QAX32378.1 hypothetical protein ETW24_23615 [Leisingera sp. NJS204]
MTNKALILLAVVSAPLLSACKGEENKTVEFYIQHPDERATMLSKCEITDAAQLEANCKNAAEAQRTENRKSRSQSIQELFGSAD